MSIFIFDWNCLLHKCFVYRPLWFRTKASARCDWLLQSVTDHRKRKEYRGFLLPAVPGAQIYIVRETSRNETLTRTFAVLTLNHSRRAKNVYVLRGIEYLRYLRSISPAFRREHDCIFSGNGWVGPMGTAFLVLPIFSTIFTGSWSAMRKLRYKWLL